MEPWWTELAQIAISGLAAILTAAVAILLPMLRRYIASQTMLGGILQTSALADRMDEGARNIIRAVELQLLEKLKAKPTVAQVVAGAKPILEREFKETLEHFEKTDQGVTDYIAARVGEAPNAVVRYREEAS